MHVLIWNYLINYRLCNPLEIIDFLIVLEYHGQTGMESGNADFDSGMFVNIFIFLENAESPFIFNLKMLTFIFRLCYFIKQSFVDHVVPA